MEERREEYKRLQDHRISIPFRVTHPSDLCLEGYIEAPNSSTIHYHLLFLLYVHVPCNLEHTSVVCVPLCSFAFFNTIEQNDQHL